jgi:hypothetical protein
VRCSAYNSQNLSILAASSRQIRSVEPNTGKILVCHQKNSKGEDVSLLGLVDECMDEVLVKLCALEDTWEVVAIGIASFVMNLVGVDDTGKVVGTEATVSYACSSGPVAKQVHSLKRSVQKLNSSLWCNKPSLYPSC